MRRRLVPLLVLITLSLTGCGVWFTHGPPTGWEQMDHFSCSETTTGPVIDVVLGALNLLGGIAIASDSATAADYGYDNTSTPVILGVVYAGVLGASAAVGFDKVKKCKAAKQKAAERQAARARSAAAVAPPGGGIVDSVRVDPAMKALVTGETVQLAATAFGPGGAVVPPPAFRWSSSNDAIASVSNTGLVTAHAQGSAVIAANADNVVGTATVVVESR
jgi:uncharacterized protein YjdB